jgi:WD40 repeat protein
MSTSKEKIRSVLNYTTLLLIIMFIITSCDPHYEEAINTQASSSSYTNTYLPLDVTTVKRVQEVELLSSKHSNESIGQMRYNSLNNKLVVVEEGKIIEWDIETGIIIRQANLALLSALDLDITGELMLGARHHIQKDDIYGNLQEYYAGVGVWEWDKSKLVRCITKFCDASDEDVNLGFELLGSDMDDNANWILTYTQGTFSLVDLDGSNSPVTTIVSYPDRWRTIANAVLSPSGFRYAVAYQQGDICVADYDTLKSQWPISCNYTFGEYNDGDILSAPVMVFSNQEHILAIIVENQLLVWDITAEEILIDIKMDRGKALAFDPLDEFLIAATDKSLQVWDISASSRVAEFSTPKVTSVLVSDDGKLIVWGDELGIVHVWAVPNSLSNNE